MHGGTHKVRVQNNLNPALFYDAADINVFKAACGRRDNASARIVEVLTFFPVLVLI